MLARRAGIYERKDYEQMLRTAKCELDLPYEGYDDDTISLLAQCLFEFEIFEFDENILPITELLNQPNRRPHFKPNAKTQNYYAHYEAMSEAVKRVALSVNDALCGTTTTTTTIFPVMVVLLLLFGDCTEKLVVRVIIRHNNYACKLRSPSFFSAVLFRVALHELFELQNSVKML